MQYSWSDQHDCMTGCHIMLPWVTCCMMSAASITWISLDKPLVLSNSNALSYHSPMLCRNHDIFRQYTEMVEAQLQKFMEEEGLSPDDIYAACNSALSSAEARSLTCLDYLMASTEYDSFIDLAFDHACMLGMAGSGSDEDDGGEAES